MPAAFQVRGIIRCPGCAPDNEPVAGRCSRRCCEQGSNRIRYWDNKGINSQPFRSAAPTRSFSPSIDLLPVPINNTQTPSTAARTKETISLFGVKRITHCVCNSLKTPNDIYWSNCGRTFSKCEYLLDFFSMFRILCLVLCWKSIFFLFVMISIRFGVGGLRWKIFYG